MPGHGRVHAIRSRTTAPNGDIYLMIRNQTGGVRQQPRRALSLERQHQRLDSDRGVRQRQSGYLPYPDAMHIDSVGDVHLVWSWAYDHARGLRHYGSYLRYEPFDRRSETSSTQSSRCR